jgi:rRNA maturation RNase YbeY
MQTEKKSVSVLITARKGLKSPNVTRIRRRLKKMLDTLQIEAGEVSILLTGNAEIKKLNSAYRRKNSATDVLSFASSGGPGPETLGDIVISLPVARKQAAKVGNSFEREVVFLLAHGLLHLAGYDHERSEKEAEKMEALQKKLMAAGYSK